MSCEQRETGDQKSIHDVVS